MQQRKSPQSYFVSIPLSNHAIAADIQSAITWHGVEANITYVPEASYHITICHLGNESLSHADQEKIKKILAEVCDNHPAISLSTIGEVDFGAQGTFCKLQIESKEFDELQHDMIEKLKASGFKPSALPCHVTIARQPGKFHEQQPLNTNQKTILKKIGRGVGKRSYDTSPVESFSFCINKKTISEHKLKSVQVKPATITTANSRKSVLDQCRAYTYDDPAIINKIATTRCNAFKRIDPQNRQTLQQQKMTVIDFDPGVFPVVTDLDRTLHTHAQADKKNVADAWRANTKHRSVTSVVSCFADGFGDEVSQFPLTLTTGCAPNFMGTSPADEKTFIVNNQLNSRLYKDTMKQLFKRWLMSQDNFGVNAVILPFVGGGVYLNKLAMNEQDTARQLILEALKEALEESAFKNIKEVIFAAPDDQHGFDANKSYHNAAKIFSRYSQQQGMPNLTVANVDIFDAANQLQQKGIVVGMINPGSDRTIGGHYRKTLDGSPRDKITLEELICNYTDTVFVQSKDFNQQQLVLKPYPPHLHSQIMPAASVAGMSDESIAKEIQNRIRTNEAIWIFDSGDNKKISFKNKNDAAAFIAQLQRMGIESEKYPGQPKTVQYDQPYFVVYLTKNQISTLSQQFQAPALLPLPVPAMAAAPASVLFKTPQKSAVSVAMLDKDLAREIANMINTKETIWIYDSGDNKKISFKNQQDAANFVAKLHNMGVGSEMNPGQPKTVQQDKQYYVVFLSKKQITALSQKLSAPSSSYKQ